MQSRMESILDKVCDARLRQLVSEQRFRSIPTEPAAGSQLIDLLSNDYLGMASQPPAADEQFLAGLKGDDFTSSASRLLSRKQEAHLALEQELEALYGRPALLFNSGYHANVGAISALASLPGVEFVCDKAIHASMIDGLAVGRAEYRRFPHNDMARLRSVLERRHKEADDAVTVIVVESVYSMDGDLAPLEELVKLKHEFPGTVLYLDEAHGFGVRGRRGLGLAEELGLIDEFDIILGTFGKALASAGAFVVCSEAVKSLMVNAARPFIFSTALPPANAARTLFLLRQLPLLEERRRHLARLSEQLRSGLEEITGAPCASRSQIVPLMVGDAARAVAIAAELRRNGFDTLPIRRPTVPPGTERIRISLNALLQTADIDRLLCVIKNTLENAY